MTTATLRSVTLPSGEVIPALGQGTWHLGEDLHRRQQEIKALRLGIDLGMTVIDTAEMYGNGAAEELIGEAIAGRRDEVFLVDKVLPSNASALGTVLACERSLRRLGTDRVDLYLLHWRGRFPLRETLEGFDQLIRSGRIRYWGVSNFDVPDMEELLSLPGGRDVTTNQVLYNLSRRGIEWSLLPLCRRLGLPVMAYSPFEQARLLRAPELYQIAHRHRATPAQIAVAWVLRQEAVATIPRAGTPEHVRDNRAALDIELTNQDLAQLDQAFPPPKGPTSLEVL
jgi:diketogulonate reductase-like aldo/keto reductase